MAKRQSRQLGTASSHVCQASRNGREGRKAGIWERHGLGTAEHAGNGKLTRNGRTGM